MFYLIAAAVTLAFVGGFAVNAKFVVSEDKPVFPFLNAVTPLSTIGFIVLSVVIGHELSFLAGLGLVVTCCAVNYFAAATGRGFAYRVIRNEMLKYQEPGFNDRLEAVVRKPEVRAKLILANDSYEEKLKIIRDAMAEEFVAMIMNAPDDDEPLIAEVVPEDNHRNL